MKGESELISLAGSTLNHHMRHVCAFFHDDDDEYGVLLPFIKDGFGCGHKAVHLVHPDHRGDHLRRLAAVGIDTAAAEASGQFELRNNTDTYLHNGRFDQDRMLTVFEQLASGNATHAFPLSRIVCRMDWAAVNRRLVEQVIEFESRVNDLWRDHDDAVICSYRLGQFGADAVIDIMRTHPMVIIGGVLQKNPFFIPPAEFLPEFRARQPQDAKLRAKPV